ncbi:patatin-like phospholipase family protein [Bacillus pseudomycoides]|uniref:patatin-like phospholipase family protein n=1 Tax=Bacillus pseudomycoides TaxID=64104 RepID=UPI000BECCAAE|nr:patatin-like phospholipase family protein [Bacillus pseudomycoides]PED09261.1 phospholipase [Bacillus pseudomycoides]PEI93114.1 phospholipase [Bacillus pseudomycoides]PEK29955.1 phospholipase [Bacillus pseudomycoides]PEM68746.1 phospholipase [Bacillus pseudomycoides]PEO13953.1 phospholipase [Bacillus pseudomycoides]
MKIDGVFEGGGVRGIAHVGAICALAKQGYECERVAGTSAGAIIAALLAAGYSCEELKIIICNVNYHQFIKKTLLEKIPFVGKGLNAWAKLGIYSNDFLETWLEDLLHKKGIHNFSDLSNPQNLKIIASDISNGKMVIFPDDLPNYGFTNQDFSIAKAVRMSSTIPFYFEPVKWKTPKWKQPCYMVDGGLLSNYPIWIFDSPNIPRWPTFGFHFVKNEIQAEPVPYEDPISMFKGLFKTMMQAHDLRHLDKESKARTIAIPTGTITSTKFQLTTEEKEWLYQSGFNATEKFLKSWNFKTYINRFRNRNRI